MRKDLGQSSINKSPVNSNSLAPLSLASCLCHYSCTGLLKWMLLNGWHCQWIIYWLWFSLLFLLTWLNSVYLDISFFFFFFSRLHLLTPLWLKLNWGHMQQDLPREFGKTSWRSIDESCCKYNGDSAAQQLKRPH